MTQATVTTDAGATDPRRGDCPKCGAGLGPVGFTGEEERLILQCQHCGERFVAITYTKEKYQADHPGAGE